MGSVTNSEYDFSHSEDCYSQCYAKVKTTKNDGIDEITGYFGCDDDNEICNGEDGEYKVCCCDGDDCNS